MSSLNLVVIQWTDFISVRAFYDHVWKAIADLLSSAHSPRSMWFYRLELPKSSFTYCRKSSDKKHNIFFNKIHWFTMTSCLFICIIFASPSEPSAWPITLLWRLNICHLRLLVLFSLYYLLCNSEDLSSLFAGIGRIQPFYRHDRGNSANSWSILHGT